MSLIVIIADDNRVGIDGVFESVLYVSDPDIHAIHWDDAALVGEIEYKSKGNVPIEGVAFLQYEHYIADYAVATQARLDAEAAVIQHELDIRTQQQLRYSEYPEWTKWIYGAYLERQGDGGAALAAIDAVVIAVDLKYPLP